MNEQDAILKNLIYLAKIKNPIIYRIRVNGLYPNQNKVSLFQVLFRLQNCPLAKIKLHFTQSAAATTQGFVFYYW